MSRAIRLASLGCLLALPRSTSDPVDCFCLPIKCDCFKPCDCGSAYSQLDTIYIGDSGECWSAAARAPVRTRRRHHRTI